MPVMISAIATTTSKQIVATMPMRIPILRSLFAISPFLPGWIVRTDRTPLTSSPNVDQDLRDGALRQLRERGVRLAVVGNDHRGLMERVTARPAPGVVVDVQTVAKRRAPARTEDAPRG